MKIKTETIPIKENNNNKEKIIKLIQLNLYIIINTYAGDSKERKSNGNKYYNNYRANSKNIIFRIL